MLLPYKIWGQAVSHLAEGTVQGPGPVIGLKIGLMGSLSNYLYQCVGARMPGGSRPKITSS